MKNHFGIFVFILLFVYSCDKQEQSNEILIPTSEDCSFLVFDNTEKFDAALSDNSIAQASIDNASNFHSFLSKFKALEQQEMLDVEGLSNLAANDNFIRLLNEHKTVQIGAWICQLNFKTKKVFVLHEQNWNKVKNSDLSTVPNNYIFSFDDEVSTYIDVALSENVDLNEARKIYLDLSNGTNAGARGVCPSVAEKQKETLNCSYLQYTSSVDQKTYSAKIKLVYQKLGIYFAVKAQVKNFRTWVGCNTNSTGYQSITYRNVAINRKKWRYKRFKRVCENYYIGGQFNNTTHVEGGSSDTDASYSVLRNKLYEGTRGLQELNVIAEFNWASHPNPSSSDIRFGILQIIG